MKSTTKRRPGASAANAVSRTGTVRSRVLAAAVIIALAGTATIAGQADDRAWAVDYPSWSDVQAARGNEAAKQAEVARIVSLISQLGQQVAEADALAVQRGNEYQAAQQAFDEAAFKADQLQQQADEAQATADKSKLRAGQLAARLARTGSSDISASLFFDADHADDLLEQLGMASKITDQSAGIYQKALQDQNTAQSLTDQANVAKEALRELAAAAEDALNAANLAVDAANAALAEQEANDAVLRAQLSVLSENREATEADFQAGVNARAAAAAAAAAARATASSAAPVGQISGSGWVRPASGFISSPYGNRVNPYTKVFSFHAGADIASGCGNAIYAAHSGTVIYSGWNGGYGNFVQISGAGGISTAYGHILNGGLLVSRGQSVSAGTIIARVGSTGNSTGCHLHYEVRNGGTTIDPVSFMRSQGAAIG